MIENWGMIMSVLDLFKKLNIKSKALPEGNAENMLNFVESWKIIIDCLENGECCEQHKKLKEIWEQRLSPERIELALKFAKSNLGFQFKALFEDWSEQKIKEEFDKEINKTII